MVRFRQGPGRADGAPGLRCSLGSPQTARTGGRAGRGRASDLRNIPRGPQRGSCELSLAAGGKTQPPAHPRSRPSPERRSVVWPRTSPAGAMGCGEPQHQAAWLSAERLRGRGRHGPRLPLGQVLCRPTGPALSQPEQGRVKRRDHPGARHAGGLIPGPFRSGEQRRVRSGQDPAGPASRGPNSARAHLPGGSPGHSVCLRTKARAGRGAGADPTSCLGS